MAWIAIDSTLSARDSKAEVRAFIFDMDGVVIDSHPAHRKAWQQFLRTLGRKVSSSELEFILDGRKRAEILRHFLGDLSEAEILEYGKRKDEFFQNSFKEVKPFPGIVGFLSQLRNRGVVSAIATSAGKSRTESTLERLHLRDCFKVVVTGSDVRHGKPDPAIYNLARRLLDVRPDNAVAVEDAPSGIMAAKAANLRCIGIARARRAKVLTAAGADHVLKDFTGVSLDSLERMLA